MAPLTTSAHLEYAPLKRDDVEAPASSFVATAVAVVEETRSTEYTHIPEAADLSWTDPFYDDLMDGVIAVFDLDYEQQERRIGVLKWTMHFVTACFFLTYSSSAIISLVLVLAEPGDSAHDPVMNLVFCYFITFMLFSVGAAMTKIQKAYRGVHVAVTRAGIRKDMHGFQIGSTFQTTVLVCLFKVLCVCTLLPFHSFSHRNRNVSMQMPFDQIQSCHVFHGFTSNSVAVQSSADASMHVIGGIKESQAFVDLVQAMMVSIHASSPAAAAMDLSLPEAQMKLERIT
jgi:hypothetical protein